MNFLEEILLNIFILRVNKSLKAVRVMTQYSRIKSEVFREQVGVLLEKSLYNETNLEYCTSTMKK